MTDIDEKYNTALEELEALGVDNKVVDCVVAINGATLDTLRDILYYQTAFRQFKFEGGIYDEC